METPAFFATSFSVTRMISTSYVNSTRLLTDQFEPNVKNFGGKSKPVRGGVSPKLGERRDGGQAAKFRGRFTWKTTESSPVRFRSKSILFRPASRSSGRSHVRGRPNPAVPFARPSRQAKPEFSQPKTGKVSPLSASADGLASSPRGTARRNGFDTEPGSTGFQLQRRGFQSPAAPARKTGELLGPKRLLFAGNVLTSITTGEQRSSDENRMRL